MAKKQSKTSYQTAKKASPESQATKWLEKINRAREVKEEWYRTFKVALAYEYLEGRQIPPGWKVNEWITINLIYANLRSVLPTLYRTDPYFYVKIKRSYIPDPMMIAYYEQIALVRQSMLNYLKGELNLKEKMRLAIFDAMFQFGTIKVHHEADLIDNPAAGEPLRDANGNVVLDEIGTVITEPEYLPANEAYKVTRIHPNDIIFDENAGPLEDDWAWIAQRITAPHDEVRNDKRYDKKARESVQATEATDEINKHQEQRKKGMALASKTKENDIVVKYEIYDLMNKQWMVIADGCNDFLIKPDDLPAGVEKHPYAFLRFFLRDSSPYPIPPVSQWLDPQREYCDSRSRMVVHRKRFNRKYQVWSEGLSSEDELTKLEVGGDGTIIQLMSNAPSVFPIADAPLDAQNYQEILLLRKDFDDVAVGPNQRGSGTGIDSATEAGIIEKRVMIQEGDDIAQVVDFSTRIAEKLDMQVQVHLTQEQAVKVTGPDGNETWQMVRPVDYEDIEGEYQYSVNVGMMQPQLPEVERSQFTAVLNLFASAPQLMYSKRLLKKIAEMYHISDDALVEELWSIAQMMLSGQIPMPGQQGSVPGSPMIPGAGMTGRGGIDNFRGGV